MQRKKRVESNCWMKYFFFRIKKPQLFHFNFFLPETGAECGQNSFIRKTLISLSLSHTLTRMHTHTHTHAHTHTHFSITPLENAHKGKCCSRTFKISFGKKNAKMLVKKWVLSVLRHNKHLQYVGHIQMFHTIEAWNMSHDIFSYNFMVYNTIRW